MFQPTTLDEVGRFCRITATEQHVVMSDHGVPQGIHRQLLHYLDCLSWGHDPTPSNRGGLAKRSADVFGWCFSPLDPDFFFLWWLKNAGEKMAKKNRWSLKSEPKNRLSAGNCWIKCNSIKQPRWRSSCNSPIGKSTRNSFFAKWSMLRLKLQ